MEYISFYAGSDGAVPAARIPDRIFSRHAGREIQVANGIFSALYGSVLDQLSYSSGSLDTDAWASRAFKQTAP